MIYQIALHVEVLLQPIVDCSGRKKKLTKSIIFKNCSVVEQEQFQTFATRHYEDVDLKELVFDAQPLKLIKEACPIARSQAMKEVCS